MEKIEVLRKYESIIICKCEYDIVNYIGGVCNFEIFEGHTLLLQLRKGFWSQNFSFSRT
jgi:hypothetical protein